MQDSKIYTLIVSQAELELIGVALAELPYRTVAELMSKLQTQMVGQQKPPQVEAQPADPDQGQTSCESPSCCKANCQA